MNTYTLSQTNSFTDTYIYHIYINTVNTEFDESLFLGLEPKTCSAKLVLKDLHVTLSQ